MKSLTGTALVVVALSVTAQGQEGAKALFLDANSGATVQASRTPTPRPGATQANTGAPAPVSAVVPAPQVTGLMYWVELATDKGQLLRVNTTRTFRSGERIRLHVTTNVDGRLNIMQSEDNGPYSTLYPSRSSTSGEVRALEETVLPSRDTWFRFDDKPGDIRLMLMVNGVPGAPPVELVASAKSGSASPEVEGQMKAQIEKLKGSKALVVEDDPSPTETARYVVVDARKEKVSPGIIAAEIRLTHQR